MVTRTLALTGTAVLLTLTAAAPADFIGISIENHIGEGWVENGYDPNTLITLRLYADFDGRGDDGVLSVFGIRGVPLSVGTDGGVFSNSPEGLDSLTAPQDLRFLGIWENQWDTYVTIGTDTATGDATSVSPGFATETNGLATNWQTENGGWFVTPDDRQSMPMDDRVMLGQFTIPYGVRPDDPGASAVSGSLLFGGINLLLRDGSQIENLRLPGPGGLAVLGVAGLASTRRRRR